MRESIEQGPHRSPPAEPAVKRVVRGRNGTAIATYEQGVAGGETVLLVHGFPDDHSVWDEIAASLANTFHVVRLDVRGSGASSRPRKTSSYRLDELVHDIEDVAAAYAPSRPVHLVGHDWGSVQGWHAVATADGQRYASFVSISGPYLDAVPQWLSERRAEGRRGWRAIAGMWKSPLYMSALAAPLLRTVLCRSGIVDLLIKATQRAELAEAPADLDRRRARDNAPSVRIYAANLPRLRAPAPRSVAVPVLVLAPAHDLFVTVASQTRVPASLAASVQVQTIRGGHWAPRFAASRLTGPITAFIAAHSHDLKGTR